MWKDIIKPFDLLIIILICAAIALLSFQVYRVDGKPVAVNIQSESGLSIYPLTNNQQLEVNGPLGTTVIEIADKKVRVLSSPCRDKLCMIKGVLENNSDWTACMPNRIYIGIKGGTEEGMDDLSY